MFKLPTFLKNISPMDIPAFELVERVGTYGKPQEDFIFANIREFESSELFSYRDTSLQYFTNNTDIDNKERFYFDRRGNKIVDTTVSNVKLKHSMYRKLVNQKVNYLLSKPFSIKGEPDTEEILTQYFNSDFLYQLQNVVRYSIMTGISWLQVYYDNDGNLKFKRIPENEVIPFWADADHTVLDAVIRFYKIIEYKPNADKIEHTKVEYYTPEGVWYYEMVENGLIPDPDRPQGAVSGHYEVVQNKVVNGLTELDENGLPIRESIPQNWGRIPFVPLKYNTQELPLLKFIKELLDDYDSITSDASDTIHDIPLSVRVVKNYDGTDKDEFLTNLKQLKLAFVSEEGDMTNLEMPLELDGIETHLKRLRKDIYENGCGVDTQDENMRDTSGEALKFRYIDLSLDCQDLGVQVSTALKSLAYFIFNHEKQFNNKTTTKESFQIVFNTDMITNESQTILDCKNSVGIISNKTILSHHPYVVDVEKEQEQLSKEQEEEQQKELEFQKSLDAYGGGNTNE